MQPTDALVTTPQGVGIKRIHRWLILAAAILVVGFVVFVYGIFTRSSPQRDAAASFVGLTNVAEVGRCAMFTVTNATSEYIALRVDSVEEMIAGVWTRQPFTNATGLTSQGREWIMSFRGWRDQLKSGEGIAFTVATPTTNGSWRVRFLAQEREPKDIWRNIWGTATPNSTVNARRRSFHIFSGRQYVVTSPEVPQ
jgi:hypothetical protein